MPLRMAIYNEEETRQALENVARAMHGDGMVDTMYRAANVVMKDAKKFAPVDTGRLRSSIATQVRSVGIPRQIEGVIGTNVEYACVFDAKTIVTTEDGAKFISKVEVGDMVLSQDGLFHKVTATSRFTATQKPDLVTIEVYWRKDKNHTIKLTQDHKILVYRDGRNKWIYAGDILPTDKMFSKKKIPHNKGTGERRVCVNCDISYNRADGDGKNLNTKFCSWDCKNEFWHDKGNNPHIGMTRSDETKEVMRKASKQRFINNPDSHPNRILANKGDNTSIEKDIQSWLDCAGYDYEQQKYINGKFVDFYVPELHTIYEADGAYWHQNQLDDIERDKVILQKMPNVKIIHVHFYEERYSPVLNMNPLRNVFYVTVNPSMKSYVDMEQYEMKDVVSIQKWTYQQTGDKPALLYDLTVEDVHSFCANGVIISNSHMEYGTDHSRMPPPAALEGWARRHGANAYMVARAIYLRGGLEGVFYMQRATDKNRKQVVQIIQNYVANAIDDS